MSQIKESVLELIGKTPMLKLNQYSKKIGRTDVTILAKLEYLNPAGSVKDRVALAMIEDAEKQGLLHFFDDLTLLSIFQGTLSGNAATGNEKHGTCGGRSQ